MLLFFSAGRCDVKRSQEEKDTSQRVEKGGTCGQEIPAAIHPSLEPRSPPPRLFLASSRRPVGQWQAPRRRRPLPRKFSTRPLCHSRLSTLRGHANSFHLLLLQPRHSHNTTSNRISNRLLTRTSRRRAHQTCVLAPVVPFDLKSWSSWLALSSCTRTLFKFPSKSPPRARGFRVCKIKIR